MKGTMCRILVFVLAVAFTVSCLGIGAFAATEENVRQYGSEGGYLAIGDSICRGCGTVGYFKPLEQYYDYDKRNVEGSFPYIVAKAIGCQTPETITDKAGNYWPLCYPGMTLGVTMDLLGIEDDFTDTAFNYGNYDEMMERFGYEGSFDGVRGETYKVPGIVGKVTDLIDQSSLITVELGMCDVFYRGLTIATNGGKLHPEEGEQAATDALSDPSALLEFVQTYLKELYTGFNYWREWYPKLIEYLKEENPNATIVMVGSFNLAGDLTLLDQTMLPIGNAVTAITAQMNLLYRLWAKQYGVLFADITNTETRAAENGYSFLGGYLGDAELASHPAEAGNAYIARQILSVLPEAEESEKDPATYIDVDLGRFNKVDYVLVNGVPVKDYQLTGSKISIPCYSRLANNLTIAVKGDDGKIAVQTYHLVYKIGTGYTAYRVYGNNDIVGTAKRPAALAKTIVGGLFGTLKG